MNEGSERGTDGMSVQWNKLGMANCQRNHKRGEIWCEQGTKISLIGITGPDPDGMPRLVHMQGGCHMNDTYHFRGLLPEVATQLY